MTSDLEVQVIADNYATHKTALMRNWLTRCPRFHMLFKPTSASWLNIVERWIALLTDKPLRRVVHRSNSDSEVAVYRYMETINRDPKPFICTKTDDEILANVVRFCNHTLESGH